MIDVVELTAELVRIDSTSGGPGEDAALGFVADWLRREGLDVHVTAEAGRDVAVLALPAQTTAPSDAAPVLLFAGHVDVVPVSDPDAWSHPPFAAVIDDGRLIGRGASDMKSGLAAAMVATVTAARDGRRVALGVTTGEELGCLGAPALAGLLRETGLTERVGAVVVPESTDNEVVLGHRGATWLTVSSEGRAAHGSAPERGVNAVLRLARALTAVDGMPLRRHPELGAESVNVGWLHGGSVPNIVPDRAEAGIDLRTVSESEPLVEWWTQHDGIDGVAIDLSLDAVWTDREHPFVVGLPAGLAEAPASYFTDASVLTGALPRTVAIVIWGPGDPATVHTVGESVRLDAVREAARLYGMVASGW